MAGKEVNIIFLKVNQKTPVVQQVMAHFDTVESIQYEHLSQPAEAQQVLSMYGGGIVIFEIHNKENLVGVLNFLKTHKKQIKNGSVKVAGFNHIPNEKVQKALMKFQCQDILKPDIPFKSLKFKFDFWIRTLKVDESSDGPGDPSEKTSVGQSSGASRDPSKSIGTKENVVFCSPLEISSDIFLLEKKMDAKKILRNYLVRFSAPGPMNGQWVEVETKAPSSGELWKWWPKEGFFEQFMGEEEGSWYFQGNRPEFQWKEKQWVFSGSKPGLYFKEGDVRHFRLFWDQDQLHVAENSDFAETKRDLIQDQLEQHVKFKKEKESKSADQQFEGDEVAEAESGNRSHYESDRFDTNMRGKNSDEEAQSTSQTGKVGEQGPLNPDSSHYRGKLGHQKNDEDSESKREKFQEENQGGHYGGEVSPDELGPANYKGKLENQQEEDSESKREKFQDENQGGQYGGEVSSDDLGPSKYKGKLEHQQEEDNESKREKSQEDNRGGQYGGEISSDDLGPSKYKGRLEHGREDQGDHNRGSDHGENLGPSKYRGKLEHGNESAGNPAGSFFEKGERESRKRNQSLEQPRLDEQNEGKVIPLRAPNKPDTQTPSIEEELNISLESGTMQILLVKKDRSKDIKKLKCICAFNDFYENQLFVETESDFFSEDEKVSVSIQFSYNNQKLSNLCHGNVIEVTPDGKLDLLCIDLIDSKTEQMDQIMNLYQEKQANINNFFKAAKG